MPPIKKLKLKKRRSKNKTQNDSEVRVVSYEEAKRLGDQICVKYKEAFDLLKDK